MKHLLVLAFIAGTVAAQMLVRSPAGMAEISECDQLNETQLKELGEGLMEQMMGSEAHEAMESALSSELSELMDLRMGKQYTGCDDYVGYGVVGMPMMGAWNPFGYDMMGGGLGMISGVLFWLAVIVVIYWILTRSGIFAARESALSILKKRYARGEISAKKFKQMKRELK